MLFVTTGMSFIKIRPWFPDIKRWLSAASRDWRKKSVLAAWESRKSYSTAWQCWSGSGRWPLSRPNQALRLSRPNRRRLSNLNRRRLSNLNHHQVDNSLLKRTLTKDIKFACVCRLTLNYWEHLDTRRFAVWYSHGISRVTRPPLENQTFWMFFLCSPSSEEMSFKHLLLSVFQSSCYTVSNSHHLSTELVWYSNGQFVSGCQMVQYSNGGLKTGLEKACLSSAKWRDLPFECRAPTLSGIQMVTVLSFVRQQSPQTHSME